MRILTAEEMRQVDLRAIEELGIPGLVLMENAAIGAVDALADRFPQVSSVAVLCGPGNNGGDGLAMARHLEARGYRQKIFLVLRSCPKGDAATQLDILERAGFDVQEVGPEDDLLAVQKACLEADLIIDALFGTGLSRPLGGHYAELVKLLGSLPQPVLAVDLPSGLDGSRAEIPGPHFEADLTVTFAAPKVAHVLPPARDAVGEWVVTDLGIPSYLVPEAPGQLHLSTAEGLAACLLQAQPTDHKGTYGHVLLVAGAPGKAGAAILAAQAAVRGGAGLVTVAVPEPILATVDGAALESMTVACGSDETGALSEAAAEEILSLAEGKAVVALGPGLGTTPSTQAAIRKLVEELAVPVVLDADGLNAFADEISFLGQRRHGTVLTPHPGEMARLLGCSTAEVQADRLKAARSAAEMAGAVVVLKGHQTLIATSEGEIYINPTGHPGMATGGSGDVLTGLLAAQLARGYRDVIAGQLAVFLHGLAGDLAAEDIAPEALRAGDLVEYLGPAFDQLRKA